MALLQKIHKFDIERRKTLDRIQKNGIYISYEIWTNNRFRIVKFYNIVMIKSTSIFQGNPHVFLECRTQKTKRGLTLIQI